MVQISEVKGDARQHRTSAHSHIKGLGLRSDGYAENVSAGFVGQAAAREVWNRAQDHVITMSFHVDTNGRLAAW